MEKVYSNTAREDGIKYLCVTSFPLKSSLRTQWQDHSRSPCKSFAPPGRAHQFKNPCYRGISIKCDD